MNLDNPVEKLARNGEKENNFGSVWADKKMGAREFMGGRRIREERERMKEKLDWRGED